VQDNPNAQPLVCIKYNGSDYYNKKCTRTQKGVEWWDQIFKFKIRDIDIDWMQIQLRDKHLKLIGSTWMGEIQLQLKDLKDGSVHDAWYPMGRSLWKVHTRNPRGYVHLVMRVTNSKFDRPFLDTNQTLSIHEWESMGRPMPGFRFSNPYQYDFTQSSHFELIYPNIQDARHTVKNNSVHILLNERHGGSVIEEMQKLNKVNCLHKGDFENCTGKRYMVCVDGTESSRQAFENTLKLINPSRDHLFFVTVRERVVTSSYYEEKSSTILRHKVWRAAAGILSFYEERLKGTNIEYTAAMPEGVDARSIACAMVKRYKIDVLVIGKHKPGEVKAKSRRFRSFQKYCQAKARCSVMTF